MTERLLDLDPTLSDQAGSLMFTKVIDPLVARLGVDPLGVDIGTFILARLQEEFPELDVNSPGSVLKDVLVAPLALILEPLRREIFFLRTQNSLADATALSEPEMDALLSNILSERLNGANALGNVRVYFNSAKTVGVDSSIIFSTADGINFTPTSPSTYFPENFTRSGNHWYIDISVRSMEATIEANVPKNSIKFVNGLDNVARVTNSVGFSGGITEETNEEFLARAERSLSERSLNTERGIETDLFNKFSDITSIRVIGHGEPEMQRDILEAECNRDVTETLGPLIYMSADWATREVISGNITAMGAVAPMMENGFPFTNTIVFNAPPGGWDIDLKTKMLKAKYLRVSDGNQYYHNTMLNRVRVIDEIKEHMSGDIYVRTKDFEVFPPPADIFSEGTSVSVSGRTDGPHHGLNKHSWQGSDFKMIGGGDDALDYVTGAHLPFTDHIDTEFDFVDVPGSVIAGRDFLVVVSRGKFDDDMDPVDANTEWSKKIMTFPLLKHFGHEDLGVGRSDGFLVSKDRILYKGEANFEYEPNLEYSGLREHTHIRDFGGPKLSDWEEDDAQDIVWGGIDKEDYGRRPGVAIEGKKVNQLGMDSAPTSLEISDNGNAEPQECDIILNQSQTPWSARGIQEGDYVACTVYAETYGGDPYKGKLTDADEAMLWHAWGRIKKVGFGSPWRLRVEGLDWRPLHTGKLLEFSPVARAEVTIHEPLEHLGFDTDQLLEEPMGVPGEETRYLFGKVEWFSGSPGSWRNYPFGPVAEPEAYFPGTAYDFKKAGCTRDAWQQEGTQGGYKTNIDQAALGNVLYNASTVIGTTVDLHFKILGHGRGDGTMPPPPGTPYAQIRDDYTIIVPWDAAFAPASNSTADKGIAAKNLMIAFRDLVNEGSHPHHIDTLAVPANPTRTFPAYLEFDPIADADPVDLAAGTAFVQFHFLSLIYHELANQWEVFGAAVDTAVTDAFPGTGFFTNITSLDISGNIGAGDTGKLFDSPEAVSPGQKATAAAICEAINAASGQAVFDGFLGMSGLLKAYLKYPSQAADEPCTFIVECLDPVTALPPGGNGWTVRVIPDGHATPVPSQIEHPVWDGGYNYSWPINETGYPEGNVNGGYIGGFGARKQVVGKEPVTWPHDGFPSVPVFDFNHPDSKPVPALTGTVAGSDTDDYWGVVDQEEHPDHATPYEELGSVVASGGSATDSPPTYDAGTNIFVFRLNNVPAAEPTNSTDSPMLRIVMEVELPGPAESTSSSLPIGTKYPETKTYKLLFTDDGNGNIVYDPAWVLPSDDYDPANPDDHPHGNVQAALGDWLDTANSKINYTTGEIRLAFKEDFELSWPNWSNPNADWGGTPGDTFEWPPGYDPLGPPRGYTFHPNWTTLGSDPAPYKYDGGTVPVLEKPHVAGELLHPVFWAGYTYVKNPYRAFYTVYRGMSELLTPTGVNTPSYDEFAFLPAHRRPNPVPHGYPAHEPIHTTMPSGYYGDMWESESLGNNRIFSNFGFDDTANEVRMVWIRLGKPFNVVHPSIGGTPSEKCFTAELVDLDGAQDDITALGVPQEPEYSGYTKNRYRHYIPKEIAGNPNPDALDIDDDGTTTDVMVQPTSLPLVGGSTSIDDVDKEYPDLDFTDKPEPNEKGLSGFLIPYPMGNNYDMLNMPFGSSMNKPMSDVDLLEHQVAHLYEGFDMAAEDSLLTISGIPGGTPFPTRFGVPLEIVNNQVHIGGMTDVYLKPGATTEATSEEIRIQPEAPVVPYVDGGEVVFAGSDGKIDCLDNPVHFNSPTLHAELTALFGSNPRPLDNLVLEILDPPSPEIQPTFFRIIHTFSSMTNSGVKIDGEFPESLGLGFDNLRFRVMKECSTNLVEPLTILKQGDDLIVHENEMSAFSPSGYQFGANPVTAALYLHIDSEINYGEYRIEGINLNTLILTTAIDEEGTNLKYRIYTKQGTGLDMPMVRVKNVSLAGDNGGLEVPYKHPVDVVSSDFSGLNDDPINEDTIGVDGGTLSVEYADLNSDGVIDVEPEAEIDQIERVCFTLPAEVNLVEYGTARYDVLRLDDMFGDEKHWWVEAITSAHWPMNEWYSFLEDVPALGLVNELTVTETGANTDTLITSAPTTNVDLTQYLKRGDMVKGIENPLVTATEEWFGIVDSVTYNGATSTITLVPGTGFSPGVVFTGQLFFRSLGVNNRLVLDRNQALPATIEDLRFTLGHPSIGTGRVYFKDKTFFEADPKTVFTYTDQKTQKDWYLRPSPAEKALIYKSSHSDTDLRLDNTSDPAKPWRYLVSEETDFFKHNILPGDKLSVLSKVLWSEAFMSGLEEEKNLLVGGKTLAVSVNDAIRTCTFSGPNPMTLDDVVADINRQLGDVLFADVFQYNIEGVGPGAPPSEEVDGPGYRIRIFSSHDIMLVTQGTIGILSDLRFSDRDNTPTPQLIGEYTVSGLEYIEAAGPIAAKTRIRLTVGSTEPDTLETYIQTLALNSDDDGDDVWDRYYDLLFIEIHRDKNQRVYPADMETDETGLHYAYIKLTSYDPNTSTGIVPDESQLEPYNYNSLGYEVVVENENYSYSLGEDSSLKTTSVVLDTVADSFEKVFEVTGASVTIGYDRSDTVASVQSYLLQRDARVVCNNPLARHFFPAYPMFSIEHTGTLLNSELKDKIADFLSSLYPNRPLEVFDLTSVLTKTGSSYMLMPQEAAFLVHRSDRRIKVIRSKNIVFLGNQYHIMEDLSRVTINGE